MKNFKELNKKYFVMLLVAGFAAAGCSSSPIKNRLEKNFVYNCSLELIKKEVPPTDAERICTSSHNAEMQEATDTRKQEKEARQVQSPAVDETPVKEPARAPASAPASEPSFQ